MISMILAAASTAQTAEPMPLWLHVQLALLFALMAGGFASLIAAPTWRSDKVVIWVGAAVFVLSAPGFVFGAYKIHSNKVADFDVLPAAAAAGSVRASGEALWRLAGHPHSDVRVAVAANRVAAPGVLDILSIDPDSDVRVAVAANPATPSGTLAVMAEDPEAAVRRCVGENHSTPSEVLAVLASDPDPRVRLAVFANPSVDEDAILAAAVHDGSEPRFGGSFVDDGQAVARRVAVAVDVTVEADLLEVLSRDPAAAVRAAVAANPSTGLEVLGRLAADPDPDVSAAAIKTLTSTRRDHPSGGPRYGWDGVHDQDSGNTKHWDSSNSKDRRSEP